MPRPWESNLSILQIVHQMIDNVGTFANAKYLLARLQRYDIIALNPFVFSI